MGGKALKKSWSASNIEKQLKGLKEAPKKTKALGSVFGGEEDSKKDTD
ncbi:MAG: hypothetical protein KKD44_28300 [Proteobacteria bacterium]|nr:hypothetical protein [Pseudomonadota bacterium]